MAIRKARPDDWAGIQRLLDQLDYPGTGEFLPQRIAGMAADPSEHLLVYTAESEAAVTPSGGRESQVLASEAQAGAAGSIETILGVISLHFFPQLALAGDFARISYFAVEGEARGLGIGRQLEEHSTRLATAHGCELIEVHCHTRRTEAHRFYYRQGYQESPKYLIKRLK